MSRHGKAGTKVYRTWYNIRERLKGNRPGEKRIYLDRGIKLLFPSFDAFYKEVGDPPGPDYSIDRIDTNGHYAPGNVRWATRIEQNRNSRPKTRKTLCKYGHPLTLAANQNRQICLTCRRKRDREAKAIARRLH